MTTTISIMHQEEVNNLNPVNTTMYIILNYKCSLRGNNTKYRN